MKIIKLVSHSGNETALLRQLPGVPTLEMQRESGYRFDSSWRADDHYLKALIAASGWRIAAVVHDCPRRRQRC